MTLRYRANYRGIGEHILRSAWMQAEMLRRAEQVKLAAEDSAPVGDPADGDSHPGEYRDGFEVSSGVHRGAKGRAYGRVENNTRYAAALEFGRNTRGSTEGRYILTRALDAAGD